MNTPKKPTGDHHFDSAVEMVDNLGGTIKKVVVFCEQQHHTVIWSDNSRDEVPCACIECETKRRVLRIISENLK